MAYGRDDFAAEITAEYKARLDRYSGLIQRRFEVRALVKNQWSQVWPEELVDDELPMIANIFRTTVEDTGRLFAEQSPTERVYPAGANDDKGAEERERLLGAYNEASRYLDYLEYVGEDMVAAGYTAIKTWPDMGMAPDERVPTHRRLDPLKTLPEMAWEPDKATDNVIVFYTETIDRLRKQFPVEAEALFAQAERTADRYSASSLGYDLERMSQAWNAPSKMNPTIHMLDYYSSDEVGRVACLYNPNTKKSTGVLLSHMENPTGICPVQFAPRPTWADEPYGQLDDSKGMALTRNRYWRLMLDYFVRMVYGGKLVWNVKNPKDVGPDTTYWALGPDAKMDSISPQIPSFQAFSVLEQLDSEARDSAVAPRSRQGDVELNKATAAYLTKAQGQLSSVVRSLSRNFANAKRRANEAAFAQDEAFCNTQKKVFGMARGKRYALTYTPKETIKGDYANIVSYGPASGLDGPTQNIITLQKLQAGMVDIETALERDPETDDVVQVLSRLNRDQIGKSLLAGLLEPTTPMDQRLRAWEAFKQGSNLDDVVAELLKAPPAPGMALAANGAPVVPGGPSGAPGVEAPTTPLPPLAALRGR